MENCPRNSTGPEDAGGCNKVAIVGGPTYAEYLKLDKLLTSQHSLSEAAGQPVADEHLFIVIHQAYELWFKQILFDLDIIINIFAAPILDENQQLKIVNLLGRIVKILKLLVNQISVLETMPPLEFIEFRRHLSPASGFQSFQFRLLENKLGLKKENRVMYNSQHYKEVFRCAYLRDEIMNSEEGHSLFSLLETWLERTPGLEEDGFSFWKKFEKSVDCYLKDQIENALKLAGNEEEKKMAISECEKQRNTFNSILDPEQHRLCIDRGDRRLSHKALQGALMLSFYRDMPRFSQPYQILVLLMDLDSLMTKWRYNHVILVQRMLGSKSGSGGSSGYMYLRSTISDRYKVFLDLFNLSTWLIPKAYLPSLPLDVRLDLHEPFVTQANFKNGFYQMNDSL